MNLTGKQLVEQGIITNVDDEENIAQHGVDLNLISVSSMLDVGQVPKKGKTKLVKYEDQPLRTLVFEGGRVSKGWKLKPGAYNIAFKQGCKIPDDKMLLIRQRSSMLRNGTVLSSSCFDAGFFSESIGTVMIVMHPIEIEYGARVAQIYAHNSNKVENLYVGQFQGDKQRQEDKK